MPKPGARRSAKNCRSVDAGKVTDHHALIITECLPGELSDDERKIYDMVAAQITEELLQVQVSVTDGERLPCPKCQSGRILFYLKVAKCSNVDCGLTVFRSKGEKQLTDNQIADLVIKGKTSLIKGFKNKDGKTFDAHVTFDKDFRTVYEFPPRTDKAKGKGGRR